MKIKKIITTVDDEKSYSIDVDENTTFNKFKEILAGAAHLLKNCFRIYLGQQEYTKDYNDNTIQELFPDLDPVPLRIISNKDIYEFEDELISLSFNIQVPCDAHIGKYKMLYCFSCKKSICSDCFAQTHRNHNVEEKADYIAPAQLLMNKIFSNSSLYKADSRLSKYMDCVTFRSNLKLNIFDNLRKLINDLEIKFASCLEYFSTSEDETEKNTNENLELLKKFSIECFIKLKNDINTKGIIIDDAIFLTIYHKLKEIERYKNEYFEENKQKYERLNTLLAPFIKQVEKISDELKITVDSYLNKDIYENFKNLIQENIVEKIQKETVNDIMFRNIGVPRKSLNRMSLGDNYSYRKGLKNKYISPDKVLVNQKKDNYNPFQRANYSAQRQGVSESLLGFNSSSNLKSEKQNNYTTLTFTKNAEQNLKGKELSIIPEKNDNSLYRNNQMISTTNINVGGIIGNDVKRVEEITTTTTNINNIGNTSGSNIKNFLTNNSNLNANLNTKTNINSISESNLINTNNNNLDNINNNSNIQKETTVYQTKETVYPGQTTKYLTQQEYNIHNIGNIGNTGEIQGHGQTQKNITKTETITTTKTNNIIGHSGDMYTNMNAINSNINTNLNEINRNISNYSQGYEVTKFTTTTHQQNKQSGTQQGTSSNLFKGNLISVLNNEISKNEQEFHEKNMGQNINETHTEQTIYGTNGEIIQKVTKTKKVEYNTGIIPQFLFMYPLFNTNEIIGAFKDESTGRIEVDFKQAFGEKDIQLNEFPQGGAFCNIGKYLYFTGGQEKLNGIGKIFLRVSLPQNDFKIKLTKMPSMINSHWSHSMIANDDYIFVIGGYNSNKCECFNLKSLKWESMADLNSNERQRAMLFIYKDYLYAFMGYTQFSILDSIERINIAKLKTSKWEKVSISNPNNINLKFYGAGIYNNNGELFFIGGKVGQENEEKDFKSEIYSFNFDGMVFNTKEISYIGQLNFIENKFHKINDENVGNFIDLNNGCLATISVDSLFQENQ